MSQKNGLWQKIGSERRAQGKHLGFILFYFFYYFWAALSGMWNLSSLSRDQTHALCNQSAEA